MERRSGDWKRLARKALNGRLFIAIAGMMAVEGITFVSSMLASGIFQGTSVTMLIVYQAAVFIITLIMAVFYSGLSYMYLNMARNREFSLRDLLYMFSHQPDRVITAAFVLTLIDTVVSIPYLYVSYTMPGAETLQEMMMQMQQVTNTMLISAVLGMVLKIPFEMAYFLLADDPEMSGTEALKTSFSLMRGKMLRYLLLQVSFLPLAILCVFTLGFGLLWLVPYMLMTSAVFYMDLQGELDPPQDVYEYSPIPKLVQDGQNDEQDENKQDDYNSEA